MTDKKEILVHDMSLRDGMHSVRHQFSLAQMIELSTALDEAGVPLIEVTHGDGLGGHSVNYGFAAHSDKAYLEAVIPRMKQARVSALLLPGSAPWTICVWPPTVACTAYAWPPNAPRPTCRNSISACPANWAWILSAF